MPLLTPGLKFLARNLAVLSTPVTLTAILTSLLRRRGVPVPTWLFASALGLSAPLFVALRILNKEVRDRRRAAALGARLPPRVKSSLPGNFDIVQKLLSSFESGYPDDCFLEFLGPNDKFVDLHLMWETWVFTTEPAHIKAILATDFNNFVKGERFSQSTGAVLGSGVFNADGEMWKFHRSMTRPFFSKDRIAHFDLFDRHAEIAIDAMKSRFKEGYAVDFQDLMSRFTMDSATEFLFGKCVKSLDAGFPYPFGVIPPGNSFSVQAEAANSFSAAFLESQWVIAARERMGFIWPIREIFGDKTKAPMKIVDDFLSPIVKAAVEKHKRRKENFDEEGLEREMEEVSLLDTLVKQTSDEKLLKDETLNIMIAGRDTTAATLAFIFYFLSMYPTVTAKLREEILDKIGPTRRPDYDDIREMKYLRAVINETLRLYPVVPFNVRESVEATTWPSPNQNDKPIYIPEGTRIPYSVFLMHRRTDLWGPDAQEFDPERFIDARLQKYLVNNSFIFLPFNAGPRICLGQQFAYNEMSFMIIRLLQNFSSVTLDESSQPPETLPPKAWAGAKGRKGIEKIYPKSHLTAYVNGGLWVKMQEAEK